MKWLIISFTAILLMFCVQVKLSFPLRDLGDQKLELFGIGEIIKRGTNPNPGWANGWHLKIGNSVWGLHSTTKFQPGDSVLVKFTVRWTNQISDFEDMFEVIDVKIVEQSEKRQTWIEEEVRR